MLKLWWWGGGRVVDSLCGRGRPGQEGGGGRADRSEGHGKAPDYECKTAKAVCVGRRDGAQGVKAQTAAGRKHTEELQLCCERYR